MLIAVLVSVAVSSVQYALNSIEIYHVVGGCSGTREFISVCVSIISPQIGLGIYKWIECNNKFCPSRPREFSIYLQLRSDETMGNLEVEERIFGWLRCCRIVMQCVDLNGFGGAMSRHWHDVICVGFKLISTSNATNTICSQFHNEHIHRICRQVWVWIAFDLVRFLLLYGIRSCFMLAAIIHYLLFPPSASNIIIRFGNLDEFDRMRWMASGETART